MRIIIQSTAHNSIDSLFDYLSNYSIKNAIDTIEEIYSRIYNLEFFPYIGREIPEIADERFRELIYRKTRQSTYRIMYYISKKKNVLFVFEIVNRKQDFYKILKLHNYFKNYHNLWIKSH